MPLYIVPSIVCYATDIVRQEKQKHDEIRSRKNVSKLACILYFSLLSFQDFYFEMIHVRKSHMKMKKKYDTSFKEHWAVDGILFWQVPQYRISIFLTFVRCFFHSLNRKITLKKEKSHFNRKISTFDDVQ